MFEWIPGVQSYRKPEKTKREKNFERTPGVERYREPQKTKQEKKIKKYNEKTYLRASQIEQRTIKK